MSTEHCNILENGVHPLKASSVVIRKPNSAHNDGDATHVCKNACAEGIENSGYWFSYLRFSNSVCKKKLAE